MENFDFGKIMKDACEKVEKETGHINVLIAGRTGVGKSTLINSVFQGNMAETGQGKPVTKTTREITKDGIPLSIFDTRGLETIEYKEIISDLKSFISERRNDTDINRQLHVAWVCITEDSRRVEDAEIELVDMLAEYVPVIVIITKARADNGFQNDVKNLLPKAKNVIRIRSIGEILDEGIELTPMNLEKLIDLTQEVIPEGRRNAFAAAQKASLKQKVSRAQGIIAGAATAAITAGASPIPFSDAAVLIPIEIGMLAGISKVFGLDLSKGLLGTLVSSMLGTSAATLGGKAIVSGILKCIPGAGTVIGAVVSGATAGTLTTALGELYVGTLKAVFNATKGEVPTAEQVVAEFKNQLAKNN